MLERIGTWLSVNFIYILYLRQLISPTIVVDSDYILVILCFCLGYLAVLMLAYLYRSYQMQRALILYKQRNSSEL